MGTVSRELCGDPAMCTAMPPEPDDAGARARRARAWRPGEHGHDSDCGGRARATPQCPQRNETLCATAGVAC